MTHQIDCPELEPLATPIGQLHTLDGNPRRGNLTALKRSLVTFGQRKPIVALEDGTVIAGNHTLMAARKAGWSHIAVVRVADDPETASAFALADNRVADLAGYDEDALAELLASIDTVGGEVRRARQRGRPPALLEQQVVARIVERRHADSGSRRLNPLHRWRDPAADVLRRGGGGSNRCAPQRRHHPHPTPVTT